MLKKLLTVAVMLLAYQNNTLAMNAQQTQAVEAKVLEATQKALDNACSSTNTATTEAHALYGAADLISETSDRLENSKTYNTSDIRIFKHQHACFQISLSHALQIHEEAVAARSALEMVRYAQRLPKKIQRECRIAIHNLQKAIISLGRSRAYAREMNSLWKDFSRNL